MSERDEQPTQAEHAGHKENPRADCALCTTDPDGRRIFLRGQRTGKNIQREGGTPEPDPAVPVRSIMIVWTRHPDGLWRATSGPSDERHVYRWPSLLNTFPRLIEVLPGDPGYSEP